MDSEKRQEIDVELLKINNSFNTMFKNYEIVNNKSPKLDEQIGRNNKKRIIIASILATTQIVVACIGTAIWIICAKDVNDIQKKLNKKFLNKLTEDNVLYIDSDHYYYTSSNKDYKYMSGKELKNYLIENDIELFGVESNYFTINGDRKIIDKELVFTKPYDNLKDYNLVVDVVDNQAYNYDGENNYKSCLRLIKK